MRKLFLLLLVLFTGSTFAQDVKPSGSGTDNPVSLSWSKLGPTVEGVRGFTLFGRGIRLNRQQQYELWIKIVPAAPAAGFIKRYDLPKTTGHVLQYATVDCAKNYLSLERTAIYDSADQTLTGNTSAITPSSKRATVKSGSVGEMIFKYVCTDPTSLPMTQN